MSDDGKQLALAKLPELDQLIDRATSVRRLLEVCSEVTANRSTSAACST